MKRLIAPAALTAIAALATACGGSSSGGGASLQPQTSAPSSTPASSTGGGSPLPSAEPAVPDYPSEPKLTNARGAHTAAIVANLGNLQGSLDRQGWPPPDQ